MVSPPPDRCGYEWPTECRRSNGAAVDSGQSCCYRRTLDDSTDRCVWHTNGETELKTVRQLNEDREAEPIREQNRPYAELLDGAILSRCMLGNTVALAGTALRGCELVDANLENAELSGVNLAGANLTDTNLRGANLKGATLTGANLRNVDLTNANLGRATLTDANFYEATLEGAYLGRADLVNSNLESANLKGANFGRAELTDAILGRADLTNATFQGATLTDASLGRADVTGANFYKADLTKTYFGRADMRDSRFEDADLTGANLGHAKLANANLRHAVLANTTLGRADLTEANLGRADLSKASLANGTLTGANLKQAELAGANLRRVDLTDANLEAAGLTDVDLARSDASDACFRGGDLTGISLYKVTLARADLRDGDLSDGDLREAVIQDVIVNQGTKCGMQTRAEREATDAPTWDAIARAYNDLKQTFSTAGLVGKARQYHVLERRARGFEAKTNGSITAYLQFDEGRLLPSFSRESGDIGSYGAYVSSLASRVTTGFGVRPLRLVLWMLFLFGFAATLYTIDPGVSDSVYYSVVTFTTAPPVDGEPTIAVVRGVELIETFGGTLLIVLLGYVLGNRERF